MMMQPPTLTNGRGIRTATQHIHTSLNETKRTRMNLSMSSGASGSRSAETLWWMLSTASAAFLRTYECRCSRHACHCAVGRVSHV